MRDGNGQQLAYVYFEDEPGRRSAAKLLTRDEARRIAANIAKLPQSVAKGIKRAASDAVRVLCQSDATLVSNPILICFRTVPFRPRLLPSPTAALPGLGG